MRCRSRLAATRRVQFLALLVLLSSGVTSARASIREFQQRCVVPQVKRENLKAAEARLRGAGCSIGRIRGPRNGVVTTQRPTPGRYESIRARISLSLTPRLTKHVATIAIGIQPAEPLQTSDSAPTAATPQPVGIPGNWNLVLDSEFNGPALDTSVWRSGWFGSGVTAPVSPATSLNCNSPSNVTFPGDGTMHLNVTAAPSTCGAVTMPYTGALINTDPEGGDGSGGFTYTYGVLEARVYLPAAGDLVADWPAVWADGQSWPADGEDDLLEGLNGNTCSTWHGPSGLTRGCEDITPGWHTFASDWEPGSVTYYYDGVSVASFATDITASPMYLILDNAVRSIEPSGVTEADSMQVQYVRVWQH